MKMRCGPCGPSSSTRGLCGTFLSEVVPGLINFWVHKIEQKHKRRLSTYAQLINEGYDEKVAKQKADEETRLGIPPLISTCGRCFSEILSSQRSSSPRARTRCARRSSVLGCVNHMAEVLPIEKQGLEVAAAEHEGFAIKLLDLCPNQARPRSSSSLRRVTGRATCWSSPSIPR